MQHPFDGRMVAGAFKDNAVVPYEGVCCNRSVRRPAAAAAGRAASDYVGWSPDGHAGVKMAEVDAHLDETWFAWMGSTSDDGPFYYRVQSPVMLVEFDHHPGVVFDNAVPSRHHIHTDATHAQRRRLRHDLLAQHHDRFDHSHGTHAHR